MGNGVCMSGSAGRLAIRVRVETMLAVMFGVFAVVTTVWPTWIESITGLEPDAGSGDTEWAIVAVFAVASVSVAAIARHDSRKLRAAR
jgi:hypothetical protein